MRKGVLVFLATGFFVLAGWAREASQPYNLAHRMQPSTEASAAATSPSSLTVPAETEVAVQMLSGVHTRVSHVDDPVIARLLQPVYVKGRVALPPGSLLDGRVTMIHPTGRMHRPAELGLRFESITLPDGQKESIAAVLAAAEDGGKLHLHIDSEGHLTASRGLSWKSLLGGVVGLGALGAARAAVAGPTAISSLLPLGGAAVAGFELLWPRGNDVNLPPDSHWRVRLNYPVTVLVSW